MTLTKTVGASVAGIAIAAAPILALAHDDGNTTKPTYDETAVSINIANNGSVLVRGARVTDVNDDIVTAQTTVGDLTLTWRLDTDSDTGYVDEDSDTNARGDIDTGDYVSFTGSLETDEATFTVNADTIRDWSLDVNDDNDTDDHGKPPFVNFWSNLKFPGFSFWGHAHKK